ncbi:hypothetical protein KY338_01790 [Candidatus Woesearchaeota archaeon]|nr:hypothetical protein [Candidatus Woesearchaeota archaeon]MBW3005990.1 hypothetical protein [Candidatus Woesearchaeota archaeon]
MTNNPDKKIEDPVYCKLTEADLYARRKKVENLHCIPKKLLRDKIQGLMGRVLAGNMGEEVYQHIEQTSIRGLCDEWGAEIREEHGLSPKGYSSITAEKALEACRRRDKGLARAVRQSWRFIAPRSR